jgi:putative flippase GtrA
MSTYLRNLRDVQALRYLAVGACNTLFGYSCFALLTMLLTPVIAYGYVLASLLANLLSITFAFLGYKWFVFKTEGNYLKEWIRCLAVYFVGMVLSAAALPFAVAMVRRQGASASSAPYIAGAIVLVFSIILSFFGHRRISFATDKQSSQIALQSGPSLLSK